MIWQLDSDEAYTRTEIDRILKFVETNPFTTWFRVSFKNYVGDGYLEQPFTPPRIFRTKHGDSVIKDFTGDNDISYTKEGYGLMPQEEYPSLTVPKNIAWVTHYSWPNTEKSKKKIEYQEGRWGNGRVSGCSLNGKMARLN